MNRAVVQLLPCEYSLGESFDIPQPVMFTQAPTFDYCHITYIEGRRWGQTDLSACGWSNENIKPFACNKMEPNRWVSEEEEGVSPIVWLCYCLCCVPPEKQCP